MQNKYDVSAYNKRYRAKYQEKFKEKFRSDQKRLRNEIFQLLGDECFKCGFLDKRALQIDHIKGGGCRERNTNGVYYYGRVIKSIKALENKYQLLCANCNWIKRYENKEWDQFKRIVKDADNQCTQNQTVLPFLSL